MNDLFSGSDLSKEKSIEGTVQAIFYQNEENGYVVLSILRDGKDPAIAVGVLPGIRKDIDVIIHGKWINDPKYGLQFRGEEWEERLPVTREGIVSYLTSGLISGVGRVTAERIVDTFGLDTIDIIERNPMMLLEVKGIRQRRLNRILQSWSKYLHIKRIMIFLKEHGVQTGLATKIFKTYGDRSLAVLREDPYRIIDDIYGVGFKIADTMALKLGYEKENPHRIAAGILHRLTEIAGQGHVYSTEKKLIEESGTLLEVETSSIEESIQDLIKEKKLLKEEERIYHPMYYYAEMGVARRLVRLLEHTQPNPTKGRVTEAALKKATGMEYDEVQMDAIKTAIKSKVMVLTGGPGTGKTTTTKGIIAAMTLLKQKILLAAPTGRAAKRLSEATGENASTIHRLLHFTPSEGCQFNEENPLPGDVLIVDECSMIDLLLMNHLLKALSDHMRLFLIGDADQLPSVGAGNVLHDIIESERITVVRLTRVFRQAEKSRIVRAAHAVHRGEIPDLSNGRDSDFFFLEEQDTQSILEKTVDLVQKRLPRSYGVSPEDVQVLSPIHKGPLGTERFNSLLQKALNDSKYSVTGAYTTFREGDRVMQTRNDYKKEVYNGDIGYITYIDQENDEIEITFEGKKVTYEKSELDEITLAYATTIHKSQGSEYPIVIIPMVTSHYIMLQRNLLYTAITRSRRICILIGQRRAVKIAIDNAAVQERNSYLKERIRRED